jgi:hypothetical protein
MGKEHGYGTCSEDNHGPPIHSSLDWGSRLEIGGWCRRTWGLERKESRGSSTPTWDLFGNPPWAVSISTIGSLVAKLGVSLRNWPPFLGTKKQVDLAHPIFWCYKRDESAQLQSSKTINARGVGTTQIPQKTRRGEAAKLEFLSPGWVEWSPTLFLSDINFSESQCLMTSSLALENVGTRQKKRMMGQKHELWTCSEKRLEPIQPEKLGVSTRNWTQF